LKKKENEAVYNALDSEKLMISHAYISFIYADFGFHSGQKTNNTCNKNLICTDSSLHLSSDEHIRLWFYWNLKYKVKCQYKKPWKLKGHQS